MRVTTGARRLLLSVAVPAAIGLAACTSLAPQIRAAAIDHGEVLEAFTTQSLVVNVLRARDRAPLSFADLPIIHGSLNVEASVGLGVPFGYRGSNSDRSSASPSLKFTSAPTFDTVPLNKQTFTLGLLQPVSPVFIESIWSAGLPRELLLHLFAESMRLPDGQLAVNDPEDPVKSSAFANVVAQFLSRDGQLRSYTVLEKAGPPILYPNGTADPTQLDGHLGVLGLNPNDFALEQEAAGNAVRLHVLRKVDVHALCFTASADSADTPGPGLRGAVGRSSAPVLLNFMAMPDRSRPSAGGNGAAASPSMPFSERSSQVFSSKACGDTIVRAAAGNAATDRLGSVRWRSTLDVFRYLGAVQRRSERDALAVSWRDGSRTHRLFGIARPAGSRGQAARIQVDYLGVPHAVAFADGEPAFVDHTLDVLGLLKQLVDAAKFADEVPVTRTLRVVP